MLIVEARGEIKVIVKSEDLEMFQSMLVKDASFEYQEREISDEAYEEIFNSASDEIIKAGVALQVMGLEVEVYEGADKQILIKTSSNVKAIGYDKGIKACEIVKVALDLLE